MTPSKTAHDFISREEGCRLKAYQDSVGIWTIGYGNTFYEDGTPVKKGDIITPERANHLFSIILGVFAIKISQYIERKDLTENQFAALLSLAYNIGSVAFRKSGLLRMVNANPANPAIGIEFEKWKNAGGKPILLARRRREATLYFT